MRIDIQMKNSKVVYMVYSESTQHNKALEDIDTWSNEPGYFFIVPLDVRFNGFPTTIQEGEKL